MKILARQCRKHSQEVIDFPQIKPLIEEMTKLCVQPIGNYKAGGYALAHCQVDHDKPLRFFVTKEGATIINPKILLREQPFIHIEGCLSYPFRPTKKVKRYNKIEVEYYMFGFLGKKKKKETLEGLMACIFQHEIDHFNGIAIYS